jgi:hypothetical protein
MMSLRQQQLFGAARRLFVVASASAWKHGRLRLKLNRKLGPIALITRIPAKQFASSHANLLLLSLNPISHTHQSNCIQSS